MASEVGRIVAVLVCFTGNARGGYANESDFDNDHPTILVENIRRQLMNENYDYMPSESEEMFPLKHELSNEGTTDNTPHDSEDKVNRAIDLDSEINDQFIPRANDLELKDDFENDNSHSISKKDLLYYVDDVRLKHEATEKAVGTVSEADNTTTTILESTSPKVKYKVLKVKQPHPNRRSQTFRRFIQEEGDDGVAIINLNDEPFPDFRLPRNRRQYMMDQDDFDSEMEIAPFSEMEEGALDKDRKIFEEFDHLAK